ncbi:diacylglycerol/lipid kinase family protein [Porphyrobacter sp. LM 6]|uniref:diacylglycerol/lipid kinase family protein n=1 Tax=Porphyrobacter sp. LM 6 TaxID=1896196 RepID=UPI000846F021|nr:diacylglycerol kinase family protein [Porphyrobacter sp. LM 6]AOL93300.1 Diacylglycerol kinase family enzyme [Porphyrobacter sp. LM 6]
MATPIYEFAQIPRVDPAAPARARTRKVRAAGQAPTVGVIYNPRSHRNLGADFDCSLSPHVHIAQPRARAQLPEALADFAAKGIDLLVINGGDGTVRDVLTCGQAIFGDDWPEIAVLPKGKTNALTIDLGIPDDWTLQDAIDALDQGGRVWRRPIAVSPAEDGASAAGMSRVAGFILGAGAFTKATQAGQSAHKLGAFDSMVVAVTGVWALLQSLFASRANPWRKGARMRIGLGASGVPMEHSGHGDPEMRQLLFASTLERLPAGIRPFGALKNGLKLVAVDQISRRTTALIPLVLLGKLRGGLRERGIHQLTASHFTLSIDDQFILDGEAFPAGDYLIGQGPELAFVTP